MSKTAIIIATLFSSAAFAATATLPPCTYTSPSDQKQSASVIDAHGAGVADRLSMGPDPAGHTGATVTPATTKTGQPSANGPGSANQSGPNGTPAPGAASDTSSTGGSATLKQQPNSSTKQPPAASDAGQTSPSASGQPSKDR